MNRREFLATALGGIALGQGQGVGFAIPRSSQGFHIVGEDGHKLFPAETLPDLACKEFPASGFSKPVCGVVHRKARPASCGMPLGGISTGCLDLDTDATFGYCSIFNSHVPRRGPLQEPFLGLHVGGKTWALTSRKMQGIENAHGFGKLDWPTSAVYFGPPFVTGFLSLVESSSDSDFRKLPMLLFASS